MGGYWKLLMFVVLCTPNLIATALCIVADSLCIVAHWAEYFCSIKCKLMLLLQTAALDGQLNSYQDQCQGIVSTDQIFQF